MLKLVQSQNENSPENVKRAEIFICLQQIYSYPVCLCIHIVRLNASQAPDLIIAICDILSRFANSLRTATTLAL